MHEASAVQLPGMELRGRGKFMLPWPTAAATQEATTTVLSMVGFGESFASGVSGCSGVSVRGVTPPSVILMTPVSRDLASSVSHLIIT